MIVTNSNSNEIQNKSSYQKSTFNYQSCECDDTKYFIRHGERHIMSNYLNINYREASGQTYVELFLQKQKKNYTKRDVSQTTTVLQL
jgi:hypothetical protein